MFLSDQKRTLQAGAFLQPRKGETEDFNHLDKVRHVKKIGEKRVRRDFSRERERENTNLRNPILFFLTNSSMIYSRENLYFVMEMPKTH